MDAPLFRRIVVAVDGSSFADHALDVAVDLTRRYQAQLSVLAVAPIQPVYVAPNQPIAATSTPFSDLPRYQGIVQEAVRRAEKAGVTNVAGFTEEGVIIDELLEFLDAHPADLVVVGSRGLSTAKRLLLGSVSSGLVTHAPCPVLVVRPAPTRTARKR